MTTLVLPPRYSDDSNTLWRTAIGLGWNIERLQSWRIPDSLTPDMSVAIYGEPIWAGFVAEQLGCRLYEPPLDWLAQLPSEFVSRRVEFLTLAEACGKEFPLFVKPAGDKTFEARVYESAEELPSPDGDLELESVPVLISEPVNWAVEYRCFVKGNCIETLSSYWRGDVSTRAESGEYVSPPDELEQACEFATRVVSTQGEWRTEERGVVVDVGLIEGIGWAVIEANPAFASGIYGCDPEKVLSVVTACPFKAQIEASSA